MRVDVKRLSRPPNRAVFKKPIRLGYLLLQSSSFVIMFHALAASQRKREMLYELTMIRTAFYTFHLTASLYIPVLLSPTAPRKLL